MNDLSAHLKAVTRLTSLFVSLCFIAWALYPDLKSYWGGLVLGTLASLINLWHLGMKVRRIGANAAERGSRRVTLGTFSRACIGLLAVVVSMRALSFSVYTTVGGLFVAQLFATVYGWYAIRHKLSLHERGENK